MRGLFVDASPDLAAMLRTVSIPGDPEVDVNLADEVAPAELPGLLEQYGFVLVDHTALPTDAVRLCAGLRHVVFLGTGARSYMDPEALTGLGVTVHTISGYGDVAVAEHAIALMWAAARGVAAMDRDMRAGKWTRAEGLQLRGRTLGLVGFGGIAAEVARIAHGAGMRVLFWNRTRKISAFAAAAPLDDVLDADVVSLHLLLSEETRNFLSAERLARLRPGVIFINTARAALVDTAALVSALQGGRLRHAALDVYDEEPLQAHPLLTLPNVTLSAHSGFYTPEASETLLRRALDISRHIAAQAGCP